MDSDALQRRFDELRTYVGWTESDAMRVRSVAASLEPHLSGVVEDFYAEIDRHPEARRVLVGGAAQVARLKQSLRAWLDRLLHGPYDREYVASRFRVGARHVEIGLDHVYAAAALSRVRSLLAVHVAADWTGAREALTATLTSLHRLIDLDATIVEEAYHAAHVARRQAGERLATIGQVSAGIAHELRNPLNAAKTSAYFLTHARDPSAAKVREHLERIERQIGLADDVITALSELAKLPVPNLVPTSWPPLVAEVVESSGLPEAIRIATTVPDGLPAVLADPAQLRIVCGNLVRNARDAMPDGGELRIEFVLRGATVSASFADTGPGIPEEVLPRVMEPFFSTKPRGLGLGLPLARAIVDRHAGRLEILSGAGNGTCCTVLLPAAPRPDPTPSEESP